jgi:hypothetical protein
MEREIRTTTLIPASPHNDGLVSILVPVVRFPGGSWWEVAKMIDATSDQSPCLS